MLTGFTVTAAAAVTLRGAVPLGRATRGSRCGAGPRGVGRAAGLPGGAPIHGHRGPPWIAAVSMPLVFAGSLYLVPGGSGATSLPMAFALTALSSLL
ncbi:type VII secretion integral membrane protein EccD, partial [Mycolicibacterium farcinogenes]|nr:type VII secretion integral membrane protein EccD [Mycolicibacterium farcinogenes]